MEKNTIGNFLSGKNRESIPTVVFKAMTLIMAVVKHGILNLRLMLLVRQVDPPLKNCNRS